MSGLHEEKVTGRDALTTVCLVIILVGASVGIWMLTGGLA